MLVVELSRRLVAICALRLRFSPKSRPNLERCQTDRDNCLQIKKECHVPMTARCWRILLTDRPASPNTLTLDHVIVLPLEPEP